jgi:hypothetical protein
MAFRFPTFQKPKEKDLKPSKSKKKLKKRPLHTSPNPLNPHPQMRYVPTPTLQESLEIQFNPCSPFLLKFKKSHLT